jgi:competence protein ComFC
MFASAIRESVRGLSSLLYPAVCVVCDATIEPPEYLCGACAGKAPRLKPPFCDKCSEPFPGTIDSTFVCANCAHRTLHFEAAVAVYRSRGVVRKLLHEFKYGRQRHLKHPLAGWLCETLDDPRLRGRRFDAIVPVPLHSARERDRGFNQATLLAELLARRTGLRLNDAMERIRYTTTQTAYDRVERMRNLQDAFRLRKKAEVRGLRVLLIDDVLTTGSTLSECSRVLRNAGAISVYAATAARA